MAQPVVLIVEDHHFSLDIFSSTFCHAEYDTHVVSDGQSALDWLTKRIPDLLVLDMHLPRVSGAQVFQQVKSDARYEGMRIMIITSDAELVDQYKRQADVTLLKPVGMVKLLGIAERLKDWFK